MATIRDIEDGLPWGFHDAHVERLEIDWPHRRLVLDLRPAMSERQDLDQRARVEVTGLVYCSIEPPRIDPDRRPYSALFGTVKANDAVEMGPHKAAAFGHLLATDLRTVAHPDLAPHADRFASVNARLEAAGRERFEAAVAEQQHEHVRAALVDDVEKQLALTEVEILKLFPGRKDLVSALLSPWEEQSK